MGKGASNAFVMNAQVFIEITEIRANNTNGIVCIFGKCIFINEMHHVWCVYSQIRSIYYIG